jgi:HK97 gp10 family phage protein
MRFDVDVTGDAQLAQALTSLVPKLEAKVIRQAVRAGARPVLAKSKANVSALRVTGERTGPLLRGLKIRALKRKKGRIGVAVQTPTRAELGIPEDAESYYPAAIEFGGIREEGVSAPVHIPAQPYMRPALAATRSDASRLIRDAILTGIEREVRRG